MKTKNIILMLGMFILALLVVNFASAHFKPCFEKGEIINYCDYLPGSDYHRDDVTCNSDMGCTPCMLNYHEDVDGGCYTHGSGNSCNGFNPNCSIGGETNYDLESPEFHLINLINNSVFTERSVLLEFSLNEIADVYYTDLTKGDGRWTRICYDCASGDPAYSRERSFAEGKNLLLFKAIDVVSNPPTYDVVEFTIDSKSPRIYRTEPRSGFATGDFEVQFKEDNPTRVTLYYGDDEKDLDVDDCVLTNGKYYCDISLTKSELEKYNGEEMEYYFEVEDIAGNVYASRVVELDVDTEPPVVNNPDSFWTQGEGRYARYIYFSLDITEDNLDEVVYRYDYNGRTYERRLCSRLINGMCEKKVSFREGTYDITVQISDEATQSVGVGAHLEIEY